MAKPVEIKIDKNLNTAIINGTKIEINPRGDVTVFTNKEVSKPRP